MEKGLPNLMLQFPYTPACDWQNAQTIYKYAAFARCCARRELGEQESMFRRKPNTFSRISRFHNFPTWTSNRDVAVV